MKWASLVDQTHSNIFFLFVGGVKTKKSWVMELHEARRRCKVISEGSSTSPQLDDKTNCAGSLINSLCFAASRPEPLAIKEEKVSSKIYQNVLQDNVQSSWVPDEAYKWSSRKMTLSMEWNPPQKKEILFLSGAVRTKTLTLKRCCHSKQPSNGSEWKQVSHQQSPRFLLECWADLIQRHLKSLLHCWKSFNSQCSLNFSSSIVKVLLVCSVKNLELFACYQFEHFVFVYYWHVEGDQISFHGKGKAENQFILSVFSSAG